MDTTSSHSIPLYEVALRIHAHLLRMAADTYGTRLAELPHNLLRPVIVPGIGQLLVSYTGETSDATLINEYEARRYLSALDAGFVGLHYHAKLLDAFYERGLTEPFKDLDARHADLTRKDPARAWLRSRLRKRFSRTRRPDSIKIVHECAVHAATYDFQTEAMNRRPERYRDVDFDALRAYNEAQAS